MKSPAELWADKECAKCKQRSDGCVFVCDIRDAGIVGYRAGRRSKR